MPDIFPLFILSFIITLSINRFPRASGRIFTIGLVIVLCAGIIMAVSSRDTSPMYRLLGTWLWGVVVGLAIKFILTGAAQVTFKSSVQVSWLWGLMSVWWLTFAAGSIGYAFASNIAVGYAKSYDAAVLLYDRSMAAAASAFFYLSIAALSALSALAKPALTRKGFREGLIKVTEWKDIDSYEWHGDMLIIHRKAQALPRWMHNHPVVINRPTDREIVDRILAQYLPDQQLQPPNPAQATA